LLAKHEQAKLRRQPNDDCITRKEHVEAVRFIIPFATNQLRPSPIRGDIPYVRPKIDILNENDFDFSRLLPSVSQYDNEKGWSRFSDTNSD
jgi:hypothetical protein